MEPSKEYVEKCLQSASEALDEAKLLLQSSKLRGAISRAYYAMFHAARAILYQKGIKPKTHSGVRVMLSQHVVKEGIVSKELEKSLSKAYDMRQLSDYEVDAEFGKEAVEDVVNKAESFISQIEEVLSHDWKGATHESDYKRI